MDKRSLAIIVAAACISLPPSPPAHAFGAVVECVNCSTVWEQAVIAAKQLEQLGQEVQTAEATLNTYRNLVINTATLPQHLYEDIRGQISQLEQIGQQASVLSGRTAVMLNDLGSGAAFPIVDIVQRLRRENEAISNAVQQAGTILSSQSGLLQDQGSRLTSLESQSYSADGIKAAIQASNGILATAAQSTLAQQSAISSQLQVISTYQTAQQDRDTASDVLTRAQMRAGEQASCSAAQSSGLSVSWCSQ